MNLLPGRQEVLSVLSKSKNLRTTYVILRFLVRLKGFEPPTFWFVAKHSIQLSYSRIPLGELVLADS